jgi:DNA repair protein RadD
MKFEPRYYQREALNSIFHYFQDDDSTHPIISLPTGSGKSLVQAMLAEKILNEYPECRLLFLTHQQELIKQNHAELMELFDNLFIDAGIYSAGLKSRDTGNKILFAGIQSVYKKAKRLGEFNLIIVDEAHSIPKKGEGMYRRFFKDMMEIAPHCKIIGLTATPYRLDSGFLTDDFIIEKKDNDGKIIKINMRLFDKIIYHISVSKLIDQKFLCPLIGKTGIVRPDTSGVKMRGGDFIEHELDAVCNNAEIIRRAVTEIIALTENRNHVLLFCVSIAHAEAVKEEFVSQGADCAVIHSDLPVDVKDQIILDFKDQKIKYVANVNMLTTGFNAKHIDCIALLRPTMSPGLYYQICGRGLRTLKGKENCLILDYAGNIGRHGPIDKIDIIPKDGKRYGGVSCSPMKYCPECD